MDNRCMLVLDVYVTVIKCLTLYEWWTLFGGKCRDRRLPSLDATHQTGLEAGVGRGTEIFRYS